MLQQLLADKDLNQLTGISRSERWRLMKAGKFPLPIKVGSKGARNRWAAGEIERWQKQRLAERDRAKA